MHTNYRDEKIRDLRDQLRFNQKSKLIEQAAAAETLLSEIEDDRDYAYDFLCYRITNYRSERPSRHNIASADLVHDLRLLIEDLSELADLSVEEIAEQVELLLARALEAEFDSREARQHLRNIVF